MSSVYTELAERIRGEVIDLDHVVQRAISAWEIAIKSPSGQDFYVDSVALNLHSFYSGLERIFELIARQIDQKVPEGQSWHRDLLLAMSCEVGEIRPAVIRVEHAETLDEFRRFRHLVRNLYTTNLQPEKMVNLVAALPVLWRNLRGELIAFAEFLELVA